MATVLWVALGGGLGAMGRYGAGVVTRALVPDHVWPLATFGINVVGSICIGVVFVLLERGMIHEVNRPFLLVGLLGGFTTFSTFSLELMHMAERGAWGHAATYVMLSVLSCFIGVLAGAHIVRSLT